ncbi:MAG TPA: competence/damage-inducible protein A [Solirubrobacteraceae bacterium]|nr:competence/damage-inducible protein A [Solirubrobacteraceae bacterium]
MRVSLRAGIVVTGTEVLSGRVSDRNGPWLADRLHELGVDLAVTVIVGDRPQDMLDALQFMADHRIDLVLTSGGLGPTADDLTAEVVGRFQGREMVLDGQLQDRIAEILRPLAKRFPNLDQEAIRHGNRKQATVPVGATVLDPVGTAPGLVVPPSDGDGPTVVVLPGPPRELQPMWSQAVATEAFRAALAGALDYRRGTLRLFGIPESEIAETLRVAERQGVPLEQLEITTCLKRGEIEMVTRYQPAAEKAYEQLAALVKQRHGEMLFSEDGSTVDEQVARLLRDSDAAAANGGQPAAHTIATAESCTGGLLAARLTDRAGASDYFRGSIVAYSNEAKVQLAGVPAQLIEEHGAVSAQVAEALADGAREKFHAQLGVGITGVAGPGGGTEEKPVGLVFFSVAHGAGEHMTRSITLPGSRADIRDRATTVAMHLIRRVLLGATA